MDIRLIISDIDGTLLCTGHPVPPAVTNAVHACRAKGIEFTIASGRWYPAAREVAREQLGITDGYMIICNGGAVVRSDGTPLWEGRLTHAQAEAIDKAMAREPVMRTSYTPGAIYRLHTERLHSFSLPERDSYFGGRSYRIVDEDEEAFHRDGLDRPYKMEAYCDDPAPLRRLRAAFEAMGLRANSAFPFNLEVMDAQSGKGAATRWLTQYLGLRREQVMGFGDYLNDLPMLEAVGWPIAVGNALDAVKQACRATVPSCEDGGVAWAIEHYILGGEQP